MEVRCNEGVAIRIGPEPCVDIREDVGEASAGDCAGQPLSCESDFLRGADAVSLVEGTMSGCAIASIRLDPAWSKTLACTDAPCTGTGRSPARSLATLWSDPHREGEEP